MLDGEEYVEGGDRERPVGIRIGIRMSSTYKKESNREKSHCDAFLSIPIFTSRFSDEFHCVIKI